MTDENRVVNHRAGNEPLFGNVAHFMGFPSYEGAGCAAEAVITGVPFDLATTGRPGARLGPWAIRQASSNLLWETVRWPWEFELTSKLEVADAGDLQAENLRFPRGWRVVAAPLDDIGTVHGSRRNADEDLPRARHRARTATGTSRS